MMSRKSTVRLRDLEKINSIKRVIDGARDDIDRLRNMINRKMTIEFQMLEPGSLGRGISVGTIHDVEFLRPYMISGLEDHIQQQLERLRALGVDTDE